jgi:cysteinyl-tRNA synthetase
MDGLRGAAASIERLRNFHFRLTSTHFPEGTNEAIAQRTEAFTKAFRDALDDDLNTAEALGALFELVRDVNTAMEAGEFRHGNIKGVLAGLEQWNEIFDIFPPIDRALLDSLERPVAAIAVSVSPGVRMQVALGLSRIKINADEIERKVKEREEARRQKNFARADAIRTELAEAGILLEDTKDGVRWRPK